jgi:hypothetical protein
MRLDGATCSQAKVTPVVQHGGVCQGSVSCMSSGNDNRDLYDDFGVAASPVTAWRRSPAATTSTPTTPAPPTPASAPKRRTPPVTTPTTPPKPAATEPPNQPQASHPHRPPEPPRISESRHPNPGRQFTATPSTPACWPAPHRRLICIRSQAPRSSAPYSKNSIDRKQPMPEIGLHSVIRPSPRWSARDPPICTDIGLMLVRRRAAHTWAFSAQIHPAPAVVGHRVLPASAFSP